METRTMTIHEARQALERYFVEHPPAISGDKRTGAVRREFYTPNFAKISRMTLVDVTE
ncbi:hypothetical protein ACFSEO_06080 [Agromyces cerinus subsp. nitratus]|uniref:hypothetical protein n=2 Tax=Agromyces cerinus TaxID=33878 RepID=UPI00363C6861